MENRTQTFKVSAANSSCIVSTATHCDSWTLPNADIMPRTCWAGGSWKWDVNIIQGNMAILLRQYGLTKYLTTRVSPSFKYLTLHCTMTPRWPPGLQSWVFSDHPSKLLPPRGQRIWSRASSGRSYLHGEPDGLMRAFICSQLEWTARPRVSGRV